MSLQAKVQDDVSIGQVFTALHSFQLLNCLGGCHTTAKEHQAALNKERVVRMHILREHPCCSAGRRRGASSPICSGDRTGIWDSHFLQDFVNERTRARAHPLRVTMAPRQSSPRATAPTTSSLTLSAPLAAGESPEVARRAFSARREGFERNFWSKIWNIQNYANGRKA
jgi:hypothetical protein